ncbi:unnamed protein product [Eruca vesicaria subsp. sativa]|uniref:Uncharacterized protein n=1 Tax=Eruca vesicaria subsp. sativa TaxID=29727 RepID=A0ABC8JU26_ERUVS|nr:unnamed protein product [Eruca vesicaria subsp. sativa]
MKSDPPSSRCRPPPDPPPCKLFPAAIETLTPIIPPEPPDPPDSFFVRVLFPQSLASFFSNSHNEDIVLKMVISDAETMPSVAAFSAIFDTDLLTMIAFETFMSLFCEIVFNCQEVKKLSRVLVSSTLMDKSLKLRSTLLKAEEINLLSFHMFSDFQVFIATLCLELVLNETARVLHDIKSFATLFNSLSFNSFPCFDNVKAIFGKV